jgi:hypothetical protein
MGVYLAGGVLAVTVVLAFVLFIALLIGAASGQSRGHIDVTATQARSQLGNRLPTTSTGAPAAVAAPVPTTTTAVPATTPPPTAPADGALCIGDSVMQAASPRYYNVLSMCGVVDAAVSRQWDAAASVVQAHAPYPDAVVIHLGTNGFTSPDRVDRVLQPLAGVRRVVLVTVQLNGTRRWEASENAEIAAAAARWPNVRIADWKAASDGHPEYFRADHIHPTRPGAIVYAGVIAGAL